MSLQILIYEYYYIQELVSSLINNFKHDLPAYTVLDSSRS
jgi:hypothetical protein